MNYSKDEVARILELPIPLEAWDFLEDLHEHYGDYITAIIMAIKSHHMELFGKMGDFKTKGKLKDSAQAHQRLEQLDGILREIGTLNDLKKEMGTIKNMIKDLQDLGVPTATIRKRVSSIDNMNLEINEVDETEVEKTETYRPSLEDALDNMLVFEE